MRRLNSISTKHQYSIVQALYWMTSCAMGGYAAVFLQYKGLSNTLIGIVVGGAACLSMAVQPLVAQITESIPFLTVKKMIQLLILCMTGLYAALTFLPLPIVGVMAVYMAMNTLNYCMPPMLSAMGMEFINRGYYLDFGLSRGIGSIAYAFCAAAVGFIIDKFFPGVLGYIYIVFAVLLMLAVSVMKDLGNERRTVRKDSRMDTEEGMLQIVMKNPVLLSLMIGFCLTNMSNAAACTYMVNIVKNLGGTDSLLGIANFVSAASEMPVMLLFAWMLRKRRCISLLKVSELFYVIKPLLLLCSVNLPMVFLGCGMQGMCFGLFTPAAVYYVNSTIDPEKRVKGQAVFSMITSGAATCGGNLLGGWLQDTFGLKIMLAICVVMAFAGMLVVAFLKEEKTKRHELPFRVKMWRYFQRRKKRMA